MGSNRATDTGARGHSGSGNQSRSIEGEGNCRHRQPTTNQIVQCPVYFIRHGIHRAKKPLVCAPLYFPAPSTCCFWINLRLTPNPNERRRHHWELGDQQGAAAESLLAAHGLVATPAWCVSAVAVLSLRLLLRLRLLLHLPLSSQRPPPAAVPVCRLARRPPAQCLPLGLCWAAPAGAVAVRAIATEEGTCTGT